MSDKYDEIYEAMKKKKVRSLMTGSLMGDNINVEKTLTTMVKPLEKMEKAYDDAVQKKGKEVKQKLEGVKFQFKGQEMTIMSVRTIHGIGIEIRLIVKVTGGATTELVYNLRTHELDYF
jgi:hypothetical protein